MAIQKAHLPDDSPVQSAQKRGDNIGMENGNPWNIHGNGLISMEYPWIIGDIMKYPQKS